MLAFGVAQWRSTLRDGDSSPEGGAAPGIICPGASRQLQKGQRASRVVPLTFPSKYTAGIAPCLYPRLDAVPAWAVQGVSTHESTEEDAGALWFYREEQQAP